MRRRWRPLVALTLLAIAVQAIVICRAELPALDSLRSVAAAEALLKAPSWSTLASEPEPPLFPAWLAVVHGARSLVAAACGWPDPTWGFSAQLAASLPLVISVIPLYFVSRRCFGRRAGWTAGLLWCMLPAAARLGGEGIPDALFISLLATSALALLHGTSSTPGGAQGALFSGGVVIGLAMLVRCEGVLLVAAFARGSKPNEARHVTRRAFQLISVAAGVMLVLGPWLMICGATTPQAALARLTSRGAARDGWVFNQGDFTPAAPWGAFDDEGLHFDSKEPGVTSRQHGLTAGFVATLDELLVATGYVLSPLAWLGARRAQGSRRRAWNRVALTGALLWFALGLFNAAASGYISSRHLLPVALLLLPAAGAGLRKLRWKWKREPSDSAARHPSLQTVVPLRLGFGRRRKSICDCRHVAAGSFVVRSRYVLASRSRIAGCIALFCRFAAVALLAGWAIYCLRPLHADRAGHRAAGEWLARRDGVVLDSWGWTALYSGQETYRYDAAREAFHDRRLRYVVVEGRELTSGSRRAATLRQLMEEQAECVAEFHPPGGQSPVLIFHWRPLLAQNNGPETLRR